MKDVYLVFINVPRDPSMNNYVLMNGSDFDDFETASTLNSVSVQYADLANRAITGGGIPRFFEDEDSAHKFAEDHNWNIKKTSEITNL